jgi:hypothetical protein
MAKLDKESTSSTTYEYGEESIHSLGASIPELYDPSKESVWTRLGLTAESFKRAPGTTGYVHTHPHIIYTSPSVRLFLPYLTGILQWSGYLGRRRDHDGPDEVSGQPDVATEVEAATLGTSQPFNPQTITRDITHHVIRPSYLRFSILNLSLI